ncbi:MAG: small multi-drug export protein [Firmicutes bacterium]|nr:small multi-drug export protein [Bacillota bacterium]
MVYLQVFFMSALPVIELRGGLPLGLYLGLPLWEAFFISLAGNMIIVYPLLWALERLETWIAANRVTAPVYRMLVNKVSKKKDMFAKYGKFALFLFVAVPLPTTGAWTACVAARFFHVPTKHAFWAIALGVVTAGLVVLFNSYLVIDVFSR